MRILPQSSAQWFNLSTSPTCHLCNEGDLDDSARRIRSTYCAHSFHQDCWDRYLLTEGSRPRHLIRDVLDPDGAICPTCNRCVQRAPLSIPIPSGPRHAALPDNFQQELGRVGNFSILFRNRRVLQQHAESNTCARYAISNISRLRSHEALIGDDAERAFALLRRHWGQSASQGIIPAAANLDNEGVQQYMQASGLPGLERALIWLPTMRGDPSEHRANDGNVRLGPRDVDSHLRALFDSDGGDLDLIINTGGHWIAVSINFNFALRNVSLHYMESMDEANSSSILCIHNHIVPAINRQLAAARPSQIVEEEAHRQSAPNDSVPQAQQAHSARDQREAPEMLQPTSAEIIAQQNAEYEESLRRDSEHQNVQISPVAPTNLGQLGANDSDVHRAEEPQPEPSQPTVEERRALALRRFSQPSVAPSSSQVLSPAASESAGQVANNLPPPSSAPERRRAPGEEIYRRAHYGDPLPTLAPRQSQFRRGRRARDGNSDVSESAADSSVAD